MDPARKRAHDLWIALAEAEGKTVTITMKNGQTFQAIVGETSMDVTKEWRDPAYVVQVFDRSTSEEMTLNLCDTTDIAWPTPGERTVFHG